MKKLYLKPVIDIVTFDSQTDTNVTTLSGIQINFNGFSSKDIKTMHSIPF